LWGYYSRQHLHRLVEKLEHFDVVPDILTFGKGVSAGYAPLGGMVVRSSLAEGLGEDASFQHSFTMSGHPIACAAGVAAIRSMRDDGLVERVNRLGPGFMDRLRRRLEPVQMVGDVRGMGFLVGIELVADRAAKRPFRQVHSVAHRAAQYAMEEGVLVYSAQAHDADGGGDYVLVIPPFVTPGRLLAEMVERLARGLERLGEELSRSPSGTENHE
jgi:adenosylmethionine-8-amino-7-oxononanoate aminotransferase